MGVGLHLEEKVSSVSDAFQIVFFKLLLANFGDVRNEGIRIRAVVGSFDRDQVLCVGLEMSSVVCFVDQVMC